LAFIFFENLFSYRSANQERDRERERERERDTFFLNVSLNRRGDVSTEPYNVKFFIGIRKSIFHRVQFIPSLYYLRRVYEELVISEATR